MLQIPAVYKLVGMAEIKIMNRTRDIRMERVMEQDVHILRKLPHYAFCVCHNACIGVIAVDQHKIEKATCRPGSFRQN